jgi:hypothetical protein
MMFKKFLSLLLVAALAQTAALAQAPARPGADKEARQAEKVRAGILKLGTGPKARVRLELRDKTELEGYVGEAGSDSFTVADAKTGGTTRVDYAQVAKLKGRGMSTGKKVAIGVGIGVAALVVLGVIVFSNFSVGHP